jgi:tetratricopeptide (TPR) repeat protein
MTDDHEPIQTDSEARAPRSRRRRVRGGSHPRRLAHLGVDLVCATLVLAPLAAGGVHRGATLVLFSLAALALALFGASFVLEQRVPRVGLVAVVPAFFLLVPALQSVPLPHGTHAALDKEGSALLDDNPLVAGRPSPLSLDPPRTRVHVGRAAAALAVFLVAFHVASGQRRRHLLPRVIAIAGIAAVAIGLGHRLFGVSKIYGLIPSGSESLLRGPFVNKNHNAEFLELAAFACLACAFQRSSALNRVGWGVGVLLCAVGAAGTLSRGAVLALGVGAVAFLLLRGVRKEAAAPAARSSSWAWSVSLVGLVVLTAVALGAGQLVDRFQRSAVTSDVRFGLWWDSLRVLSAHPLGIGRGAFGEVYPIYRTLLLPMPLRFSFVEDQPLQHLIESGWPLYAGVVAGTAFLVWSIIKLGRRDVIEAALLAGLLAVMSHSLVDFGLETLGVLLPFMAILGMVLGRSRASEGMLAARPAWLVVGLAVAGLLFGTGSVAHASYDDFDNLLRSNTSSDQRRELLGRAQRAHPVDYFYALAFARTEPLRAPGEGVSPRLHALNHALRLCPSCELVHVEVARSLWGLGLRSQALGEWREAVHLQPTYFEQALRELAAAGAKPEELVALASFDGTKMIDVATFLAKRNRAGDAFTVLDQADALGAPRAESLLTRGRLQVQVGDIAAAQKTLAEAQTEGVHDPRLVLLDAEVTLATKGAAGADAALSILDNGAARYPQDLEIQRFRVSTVMRYERWQAAARAVEGLKMALYAAQGTPSEAHIAAARIQSRLGRWTAALGEYRMALADAPGEMGLWFEFGRAAETAGRDATAREAYGEAARLAPSDPNVQAAMRRLDERQGRLRAAPDPLRPAAGM